MKVFLVLSVQQLSFFPFLSSSFPAPNFSTSFFSLSTYLSSLPPFSVFIFDYLCLCHCHFLLSGFLTPSFFCFFVLSTQFGWFQHASGDVERMILGNKCDVDPEDREVSEEKGVQVTILVII